MSKFYMIELDGKVGYIREVQRKTADSLKREALKIYPRCLIQVTPLPNMTTEKKSSFAARLIGFGTHPTRDEVLKA